ncbi:hypothetical protein B0A52_07973 [Exophiala mesophila]|uniref:AP-3 complex subunit delta n=1 Tax=Exophiala mesophila TaxID=212818 RepID=A0A438MZG7_EXOME|nr:hypothetical protein B0A52_07973 [Exophiala mesophila]
MFEKSLVDLIRGLRGHKGNEAEYIQNALKECRNEIRSQDLDVKATALLKLIYLEMFGYDMTWAAFNVLEVMASPKPMQKRVGYLAAVQTFGPETEVLMLAENLLKKDLTSPSIPILSLPLITLPHIITSSLALSILTDLLPRLSHSQPAVRKKTIVTLYRLALVYPETLRVAWPKIKERLLDENEDSSVTAATVNVVCELGWRRPQDFLPLAPRLFELLLAQKNNWMGIKIIKLFAVLTPLEPRLVRKLVRPLTKLIQETTAMSLLYECISGIIQGGILDGAESGVDVEEVADLCISKLRGMIVVDGDPNLKYVALLAFTKIVSSHPSLVAMQQDVIMACLDDPDISIKMQALELVSGMVNSDNLQDIVNKLMKQLATSPSSNPDNDLPDEYQTDLEQRLVPDKRGSEMAPLPDEYRHEIISRILGMCSYNTYANIVDFEWYVEILVHLVKHLPIEKADASTSIGSGQPSTLASRVVFQLVDITIRVQELRPESTKAAETLVLLSNRAIAYPAHGSGQAQILASAAWACGEFSQYLSNPYEVLNSLIHESCEGLSPETLAIFAQAIPKMISRIASNFSKEWNASRSSTMSLLLARTTGFLERLSSHPNLEVQERSVEFLELLRLAAEALSSQNSDSVEAPLLLTSAIPTLFSGMDLNPVAPTAQKKVPLPSDLDLDAPINPDLAAILQDSQISDDDDSSDFALGKYYHDREAAPVAPVAQFSASTARAVEPSETEPISYQSTPDSPATLARRKAARMNRNRDDPFYIAATGEDSPRIHEIISKANEDEQFDIDSIPIIDLQIEHGPSGPSSGPAPDNGLRTGRKKKAVRKFVVAADENLDVADGQSLSHPTSQTGSLSATPDARTRSLSPMPQQSRRQTRPTRNLLTVDSSTLQQLSLEGGQGESELEILRREAEELEMTLALREVEKKRLEMQREMERSMTTMGQGVDVEGTVVRRKKKKTGKRTKVGDAEGEGEGDGDGESAGAAGDSVSQPKRKSKKVVDPNAATGVDDGDGDTAVVKKKTKKKKKRVKGDQADKTEAVPDAEG